MRMARSEPETCRAVQFLVYEAARSFVHAPERLDQARRHQQRTQLVRSVGARGGVMRVASSQSGASTGGRVEGAGDIDVHLLGVTPASPPRQQPWASCGGTLPADAHVGERRAAEPREDSPPSRSHACTMTGPPSPFTRSASRALSATFMASSVGGSTSLTSGSSGHASRPLRRRRMPAGRSRCEARTTRRWMMRRVPLGASWRAESWARPASTCKKACSSRRIQER